MSKLTPEEKLNQQSEDAKGEADKLPHGKERDALIEKARQLDTASHMDQWLSSPGLKPPVDDTKPAETHEIHEGRMIPKPAK
jgi:hypothetical protein